MTFYYAIFEKRSYTREDTRLHTLISYVLLAIATVCVCIYVPLKSLCHYISILVQTIYTE